MNPRVESTNNTIISAFLRRAVPEQYRPIGYLTRLVRERTADRVRRGPFAGMHYIDRAIGSAYLPKLLGSYERELSPIIEEVCQSRPGLIIDLGAAEGYYAVGLARRNPQARVVAFEQDQEGRSALEQTCLLNGVRARMEIRGRCRPGDLETVLRCRAGSEAANLKVFVLCDVEGDEQLLLDPIAVPSLRRAALLVETHEFVHPGITEELESRFAPSHELKTLWQQPRCAGEFPFKTLWTALLPGSYLQWAMSEWRPAPMSWLWMKPHE